MVLEEATLDGFVCPGFRHHSEFKSYVSSDKSVVVVSKISTTIRATVTDRREPSSVNQDVINHLLCATIITQPGILVNASR